MTARLFSLVPLLSTLASAQWIDFKTPGIPRLANGKADLSAPAPRTADGKPDLTGVWQAGRAGAGGQYGYDYDVAQDLPAGSVLPWAESVRQQRVQDFRKDSPLAHCWPVSVPFLNFRGLSSIVQTPRQMVILYESPNSPHRTIYTDGRPLPADPNPTWLGYSVGRWDGETLVVESNGFNDKGWLDVGGHPQTESLKLTERYRRRDFGHLELEVTFEDPKSFAKPFTLKMTKTYQPDTVLFEDVCENERDSGHLQSGLKVTSESLAKFAGTYEFAPGRQVVVTVSGEQLLVADPGSPRDRLFVARSEATFSSSVSQAAIVFARDAQGKVTGFTRTGVGKDETARRVP
jgi:uncharacterized protein DUF3471